MQGHVKEIKWHLERTGPRDAVVFPTLEDHLAVDAPDYLLGSADATPPCGTAACAVLVAAQAVGSLRLAAAALLLVLLGVLLAWRRRQRRQRKSVQGGGGAPGTGAAAGAAVVEQARKKEE